MDKLKKNIIMLIDFLEDKQYGIIDMCLTHDKVKLSIFSKKTRVVLNIEIMRDIEEINKHDILNKLLK